MFRVLGIYSFGLGQKLEVFFVGFCEGIKAKKKHLLLIDLQCFFQATWLKFQAYVPKLDLDFNYVLIILAIIFQVPNHRSFGFPSVVKRT